MPAGEGTPLARRPTMARRCSLGLVATVALVAGVYACSDPASELLGQSSPTPDEPPAAPPPPVAGLDCGDPAAVRATDIRRLNRGELASTLRAALGSTIYASVEPALTVMGTDAIRKDPNDLPAAFDPSQLEAIDRLSRRAGAAVIESDANLQAVAGACSLADPIAATCANDFIARLGKQMFRRPLTAADVAAFTTVLQAAPTGREGVGDVVAAMVLAPEFLYHVELGEGRAGADGKFELTTYEIASRVSYLLTDGPPDGLLMTAADDGTLSDQAVVGAHVDRLLETEAGRAKVLRFVRYWLTLERFQGLPTAPAFLAGVDPNGLTAEMLRELDAYVEFITYDKRGSFTDLLTSRRSFAKTPALAKIYGHALPATPGAEVTTDDAHMGLLLRGPTLADSSTATHPILRGAFMLRRIACGDIPSPSTADLAARESLAFTPDPIKYSTAEMTAQRTSPAACTGCHARINPFGLALEGFDNLGRARTEETMFDASGTKIATHPVVTSATLKVGDDQPMAVGSGPELMTALSKTVTAPLCFTRHVFRYYRMEHEGAADACQLAGMYHAMQDPQGSILRNIKSSILNVSLTQRRIQ